MSSLFRMKKLFFSFGVRILFLAKASSAGYNMAMFWKGTQILLSAPNSPLTPTLGARVGPYTITYGPPSTAVPLTINVFPLS